MSKYSADLQQTLLSFVDCTAHLSLELVPLPITSSPHQVETLASLASWVLLGNTGFNFIASSNGLFTSGLSGFVPQLLSSLLNSKSRTTWPKRCVHDCDSLVLKAAF